MKISLIAAVAENGAIGKDKDLVWHLPDDLKFFKEQTAGRTVIMGRKNYESIPFKYRPLPKRTNMVISRDANYPAPGCIVFTSIDDALNQARESGEKEVYIIGGGEIYKLALVGDLVETMYITEVHGTFEADSFFPDFDRSEWQAGIIARHKKDERHQFSFTIKKFTKLHKPD